MEAAVSDQIDFGRPKSLLLGSRRLEVGESDVENVEIALNPPMDLSGTVTFEENCPAVPLTVGIQTFNRLAAGLPSRTVIENGEFTLQGVAPGKSSLTVRPAPGANATPAQFVLSARWGDREISLGDLWLASQPPGPLQITMSCEGWPVTFDIRQPDGQPAATAAVSVTGPRGTLVEPITRDNNMLPLPPGSYSVQACATVHGSACSPQTTVNVTRNARTSIQLLLPVKSQPEGGR